MPFQSILYRNGKPPLQKEAPYCFHDLHIDKITGALLAGLEEYELAGFFYTPPDNRADIIYRQDVLKDMEMPALTAAIELFTKAMQSVRTAVRKAGKLTYARQKKIYFLEQMDRYCAAVSTFASDLSCIDVKAAGWLQLREYLQGYIKTPAFIVFTDETRQLLAGLAQVKYVVILKDLRVQVRDYRDETDFSSDIAHIFARFRQQPVRDYRSAAEDYPEMNHVEASILDGVATLYPGLFQQLDEYCVKHENYLDPVIGGFDSEVHFYLTWRQYISKLKEAGLCFCIPEILTGEKHVHSRDGFDVALATALVSKKLPVITNDFYLAGNERIMIVTGPNQGGKTTFARAFGQLHYLARMGLSVPGTSASLFLYNQLYTHFEKEEHIQEHRSKFEDDLYRIHKILTEATSGSIVIFNEILSSTSLEDALILSRKVMETIDRLDCLCVWITFMDELLGYSSRTVSMVSTIEPGNPSVRTFRVIRKPADGMAYALSVAEKYGVTYSRLKQRISK